MNKSLKIAAIVVMAPFATALGAVLGVVLFWLAIEFVVAFNIVAANYGVFLMSALVGSMIVLLTHWHHITQVVYGEHYSELQYKISAAVLMLGGVMCLYLLIDESIKLTNAAGYGWHSLDNALMQLTVMAIYIAAANTIILPFCWNEWVSEAKPVVAHG